METIGNLVLTVIDGGMASPTPSEKSLVPKPPICLPETIEEAKALRAWAMAQDDRAPSAHVLQITKHLSFMAATLPSKSVDDESGKMRVAVYSKILGDFSNEALAYMARRACTELDWFPTPRQCLEILRDHRPEVTEKQRALQFCHNFWQGKYEDFILALKTDTIDQDAVDTVPHQWKMIAVEQGYLRYFPEDGRYAIRARLPVAEKPAPYVTATTPRPKIRYCSVCLFASDNPKTGECMTNRGAQCGLSADYVAPVAEAAA